MRCRSIALFAALGLASLVGCGGGSEPDAPVAGTSGSVPSDPIAKVVYEFFDAVRQGNTAVANSKLTPLSLQRITEHQMNVTPPGSATAQFQVGDVTGQQDGYAVVELIWSDVDADGKRYNEPKMQCGLRQVDGQWRICGMAQEQGPGLPMMMMNFESLEGIAPQQTAQATQPAAGQAAAAPATAATAPAEASKEVARDPFQQPVQR